MGKKWPFLLGVIIVGFMVFYFYRKYRVAPAIDLNSIGLVDLTNKPVRFGAMRGKKTVVCFSASWCGSCLKELSEISSVKEQLSDVNIVVISDEPLEKIAAFAEKTGYPFLFLRMDRPFSAIGINSIPTSYFFNAELQTIRQMVGYVDWKDPSALSRLKELMEE